MKFRIFKKIIQEKETVNKEISLIYVKLYQALILKSFYFKSKFIELMKIVNLILWHNILQSGSFISNFYELLNYQACISYSFLLF